jgi:Putative Actinobacterial Holin-X, holin superfamily III
VASTPRDQPELPASAADRDGLGRADGAINLGDPAHRGPLPEATFPELLGRLINDVSDLADRQVDLAKQEVNEAKDEAIGAATKIGIGAGVALFAGLLAIIWLWTGVIWFFNWVGSFIVIGPVSLAWLGWVVGIALPALAAFLAYKRFIMGGVDQAQRLVPPLPRTRATLREDLEWVRRLRTPRTR